MQKHNGYNMNIIKFITLLVLFIFCFSSAYGQKKVVHVFPIVSSKSERYLSMKYTDLLKEKLIKTEMFEIVVAADLGFDIRDEFGIYTRLRDTVDKKCGEKGYELVIFGNITGYRARIILYSPAGKKIVSEFKETIFGRNGVEISSKNCALKFATDINTINSSRKILLSVLMPGMGHILTKRNVRGVLYMGIFSYYLIRHLSFGLKEKTAYDLSSFRSITVGHTRLYTFKGNSLPYDDWVEKMKKNYENLVYNEKIKDKKRNILFCMGLIYMVNLIDAFITDFCMVLKSSSVQEKIEKSLSLSVESLPAVTSICLNYRF